MYDFLLNEAAQAGFLGLLVATFLAIPALAAGLMLSTLLPEDDIPDGKGLFWPLKWTYLKFFRSHRVRPEAYWRDYTPNFWSYFIGTAILMFDSAWYALAALSVMLLVAGAAANLTLLSPWLLIIPAIPFVVATVASVCKLEFRVVVLERKVEGK